MGNPSNRRWIDRTRRRPRFSSFSPGGARGRDFDPMTGMLTVHQKTGGNKPRIRHTPLGKVGAAGYAQLEKGKKEGRRAFHEHGALTDERRGLWVQTDAGLGRHRGLHLARQPPHDLQPVGDGRCASGRRRQVLRPFDDPVDDAICSYHAWCQSDHQQCCGCVLREHVAEGRRN